MFTLRRITGASVQINYSLGDSYTLIDRESSYDEFCKTFERHFLRRHVADTDPEADDTSKNVYAFVLSHPLIQPLYKNQWNYIMSENGATFANLSFK